MDLFIFLIFIAILTPFLGRYLALVYGEKIAFPQRIFGSLERLCYRFAGIDPSKEMQWKEYAAALGIFNFLGFLFLFLLQLFQSYLPLNPEGMKGVNLALAFNTAVSFSTNTNWQSYAGETTLSYFTQMVGLASQNFLSAATGLSVLLVLVRGLIRKETVWIGNFWVDLVRSIIYLLLPLSFVLALFLVSQGVLQTLSPYASITTLENAQQVIPLGPVASQEAIKQLGTNGGGFFNANSAHPFENPTAWTNLLEMASILLIPAATVYAFGKMVGAKKHALLLLSVMSVFWLCALAISLYGESSADPAIHSSPFLEGKEVRFGSMNSLIWSVSTSGTSNGSVNAMMSSLSPLAGGAALFNMMLGEIIFGGVGVGLCGMIMFVLLTVFLSGLMVGRTPEYFGKKIERNEVQWVSLAVLAPGALILIGSCISLVYPAALGSLSTKGPHGLSELLYGFTSAAANNGSAFAGLNANTDYYNLALGIVMLLGRVSILLPSLAIAGGLAAKKTSPASSGTFSVESVLFGVLLCGVILLVGGLTFFPALSLGPILEHLLMLEGRTL